MLISSQISAMKICNVIDLSNIRNLLKTSVKHINYRAYYKNITDKSFNLILSRNQIAFVNSVKNFLGNWKEKRKNE